MTEQSPQRCCVVVPLYRPGLSEAEALSLVATHQRVKSKASLKLLHPPALGPFVDRLCRWFAHLDPEGQTFESLPMPSSYFGGVWDYSSMLLSQMFYQQFAGYEWLFVIQLDALLLTDQWLRWLDGPASYIGAPWFVGLDEPRYPLRPLGGGNGGFSLRRIADCEAVLRYSGWLYPHWRGLERTTLPDQLWRAEGRALRHVFAYAGSLERIQLFEDLFWSFMAPLLSSSFKVAPFSLSSQFAFETEPRALFQRLQAVPVGCHAYERHDPDFWHELWRLHPDLIGPLIEPAGALISNLRQDHG